MFLYYLDLARRSLGRNIALRDALRPVAARFNDETITVQNWPAQEHHIVIAEFHY